MATIVCAASGCNRSDASGAYFFTCDHCGMHFCNQHAHSGKKCPRNDGGFLRR